MPASQFLIGAASSGSGKTTFTLGLLRALRNRGMKVQPFKCGPDYLDTKHHAAAAGQTSYNLDTFLASREHVRELYDRYSEQTDVCITEGVMGLFDGYDNMLGSSAEIAGLLQLPVILIVNARSTAYTVAALLYGFKHFRPEVKIAGAIFNFVGSESHYAYLKQACHDAGVEALGYLPKCQDIEIPSRHLGLNIDNEFCFDEFAERIAAQIVQTVNIERLLAITSSSLQGKTTVSSEKAKQSHNIPAPTLRISVARDEAFNFIYPENIRALEKQGRITYFSPLRDACPPPSDFIYLPGGYPELYLEQLSQNLSMRRSLLDYCEQHGPLYAECGGMMYLGEYITGGDGKDYPMCGFLPQGATMKNMKLQLGYRKVRFQGEEYRGHEFHYSHLIPHTSDFSSVAEVSNARDQKVSTAVFQKDKVIATYVHLYWGEKPFFPFSQLAGPA